MSASVDRLHLMRTYLRVAETGSFSAAARQLGLSQPSVSRQIRQLERFVGATLLRRTTHDLTLTDAGREALVDCRRLLDEWEAMIDRHRGAAAAPTGILRVIAPVGLGQTHLVALAAAYRRRYPKVEFEWRLTDSPVNLVEHGADCLIRVGAISDELLIARRLATVTRILVAAPSLIRDSGPMIRLADLADRPFVALTPYHDRRIELTDTRGRTASAQVRPVFATDNLLAVRQAAIEGLGFAILPTWLIHDCLAANRLVRVLKTWEAARLPVFIAYQKARYRPAKLSTFVDWLAQELPKMPGGVP